MTVDTQVRPAIYVGQEQMTLTPAPELAQWERDLTERLEPRWTVRDADTMFPDLTISGSGDGWGDCDEAY